MFILHNKVFLSKNLPKTQTPAAIEAENNKQVLDIQRLNGFGKDKQ